ncbi:hypothetical protein VNO77_27362 [Canavalia gladiata]|uniref:Uncharacterized protein n=1 Tax=Canavalia gladiata TaxID=3824 RepID=A0AAN9KTW2_CANGL
MHSTVLRLDRELSAAAAGIDQMHVSQLYVLTIGFGVTGVCSNGNTGIFLRELMCVDVTLFRSQHIVDISSQLILLSWEVQSHQQDLL